jgi:RNA polymerase-binding transcription factor DksA
MFQAAFQVNAFQNNAFQTTTSAMDMHDGITKEELRRIRALLKKRQQAENNATDYELRRFEQGKRH